MGVGLVDKRGNTPTHKCVRTEGGTVCAEIAGPGHLILSDQAKTAPLYSSGLCKQNGGYKEQAVKQDQQRNVDLGHRVWMLLVCRPLTWLR